MHRELKTLLETLLTTGLQGIEIRRVDRKILVKSTSKQLEVIIPEELAIRVAVFFFYLYEFTWDNYRNCSTYTKRIREVRNYLDVRVDVYILDCDEDTRLFINLVEALVEKFKYSLENAVYTAILLVMISREASTIKKTQTQLTETTYFEYQESLGKIASYLKQLEAVVQDSSEVAKLLDLVNKTSSSEVLGGEVFKRLLSEGEFTRVYYVSKLLSKCPYNISETINELYTKILSKNSTFILAPGIIRVLLKRVIPREFLLELPQYSQE